MYTFRFKARNINNGQVEVSSGPLVVEFDIYGDEIYSNIKKGSPQYRAALHVFNKHVGRWGEVLPASDEDDYREHEKN